MLDFIYYPVSWILWFWHRAFGFVLGSDSGWAWALSVVFLVFTLRLVLYKPTVKQVRTTKQMQELQPQIKALQAKHKNDRQKMALEMQKLQKDHGFNPLMGCLPMLLQVPVFLGLFHVLRSFNRTGTGFGQLGLSVQENAETPNYVFNAVDVQSFLGARIFGAPLSAMITMPDSMMEAFAVDGQGLPSKIAIAAVAIPLMIIAGVATHFNARASVARQSPEALANPQAALMNKLALYVFPLGVLVGGPFLPVAILIYWVSNNIWTYVQQHLVFGRMEKEEEKKKAAAIERRAANAPKPGAKPIRTKKVPLADLNPTNKQPTVDENGPIPAPTSSAAANKASNHRRQGRQKKRGRANQKRAAG
ncbi:membrane protein insertase YidC [Nocardia rhamnosiphila]|uniref:membrane protein insertase YidC n=1 Tax=Nocardia rhamnosiphila TaxID=426716 RepID=UPI0033D67F3F